MSKTDLSARVAMFTHTGYEQNMKVADDRDKEIFADDLWVKASDYTALQQRLAEVETALRLHLALGPDDPVLIEPAEKQVLALQQRLAEVERERDELITELKELVQDVLDCGVSFEDERIRYKEVQIARSWFDDAQQALAARMGKEGKDV